MNKKRIPDIYLTLISVAIILSGLLAMYVSQSIHSPEKPLFRSHLSIIVFMTIVGFIVMLIPNFFERLEKMVPILLMITVALLILVLFIGITKEGSYARRWIFLPWGFTIQPSEVAKLVSVVYFASVLSRKGEKLLNIKKGLVPPLIVLLSISLLIIKEPDLGTAMLFAIIGFIMFFYAGIPLRSLILSGVFLFIIFVVFIFNTEYMKSRLTAYLNTTSKHEEVYQIERARLAFNNGGLSGLNDEELIETSTSLPAATTDFIYAAVAQRFGFIGNIVILLLFFCFTVRGFVLSYKIENLFQKYLSFGITAFIGIQAYLNIMVSTLIIPTTGMPLPFISYGRNALVVNMFMLAILLKISMEVNEIKKKKL